MRDKLKLAYDDVKTVNPKLIYASLTGYGESGPDRDRPGFDATAYFARSGLLDAQRYEGGPPGVPGPAQGDRATAMALVSSILMALMHRTKTGEGSWVGTSLLGNGLWSCGVIAQAALVGAFLPHRPPPDRPRSALGNIYRTSDDRWLQLTIVRADKLWAPALPGDGLRRADRRSALRHRARASRPRRPNSPASSSDTFATQPYEHWREALAAHSVTFGVISRPQDVPDDPAGRGLRRRGRDGDPRHAAHARRSDPPQLRRASASRMPRRRSASMARRCCARPASARTRSRRSRQAVRFDDATDEPLPLAGLRRPRHQLLHRRSRRRGRRWPTSAPT